MLEEVGKEKYKMNCVRLTVKTKDLKSFVRRSF